MPTTAATGWLNLALYSSDLTPLINPRVVVTFTEPLVGTVSGEGGSGTDWFGLQANCYSPSGYETGYEQFINELYTSPSLGGYIQTNLTWITGNSAVYAQAWGGGPYGIATPIPAGWVVDLQIQTDPATRNTLGSVTNFYDGPALLGTSTMSVSELAPTGSEPWTDYEAAEAPITALTMELVGTGGTYATFSSGAGTIRYIPGGGQAYGVVAPGSLPGTGNPYYPFPAGLSIASNTIHTSENSNMQYSDLLPLDDGSYIQYFSWNGTYPQSGPAVSNSVVILVMG